MYTVQFWINGYRNPEGFEVHYFDTQLQVRYALEREIRQARRYGAAYADEDGILGTALVWKGEATEVTDIYPDLIFNCRDAGDGYYRIKRERA